MSGSIRRDHRFTVTPEHLILDPRISDRAFRLWCRLDRFAGEKGAAFPSRETLALELDTSPSSVDRALRELVQSGWLKVEERPGTSSNYVLMNAPKTAVMSVVDEARKERKLATAGRREARTVRRRKEKQDASVKKHAKQQVTGGGVFTSDDPPMVDPESGGVFTGDDPGVFTGDEPGVFTGDEHKEATDEGSIIEGGSVSPLRSDTATPDDDCLDLGVVVPMRQPEQPQQAAFRIAAEFLTWYQTERNGGCPVPGHDRTKAALAKNFVLPALESGATENQVKTALTLCRSEFPSQPEWREHLRNVRTGTVAPARGRPRAYNDQAAWGTPTERAAAAAAAAAATDDEVQKQIDAAFGERGA